MSIHAYSSIIYNSQSVNIHKKKGWEKCGVYKQGNVSSALKRKNIQTPTTAWLNPDDIMPHEITKSQCDNAFKTLLVWSY